MLIFHLCTKATCGWGIEHCSEKVMWDTRFPPIFKRLLGAPLHRNLPTNGERWICCQTLLGKHFLFKKKMKLQTNEVIKELKFEAFLSAICPLLQTIMWYYNRKRFIIQSTCLQILFKNLDLGVLQNFLHMNPISLETTPKPVSLLDLNSSFTSQKLSTFYYQHRNDSNNHIFLVL